MAIRAENLFRLFHGSAALAHIAACVVVFIFFVQGNFPLDLKLTRKDPTILAPYLDPVCNGTKYERSEFREWVDCVRASIPDIGDAVTYGVTDYVEPWKGGIAVLIITFSLITAMFHLYCFFNVDEYVQQLLRENQPLRWIEYSVTYTIMTVCIFQLNEVNGMYETALLVVSGIAQMLIGLAIEVIRRKMPVPKRIGCFGQVREAIKDLRGGVYGDMVAVALLELVACAIMLVHFLVIWDSFRLGFWPYLDSEAGYLFFELFGYIVILNLVIYLLYLGFPIVHAVVFSITERA